jgi:hypothetical protein
LWRIHDFTVIDPFWHAENPVTSVIVHSSLL